ncbi:MAG: helix-turn-helix domain-containing protein [Gemmatimonadales bacterium]
MNTVAALLDTPAALQAVRRSLPPRRTRVRGCRNPAALFDLLGSTLVDAVVMGTTAYRRGSAEQFRARFPGVPIVLFGAVRSDDARLLVETGKSESIRAVLVEGVDDPMAGELVARHGYLASRRARLAHLPKLLRLTETLQLRTFELLLDSAGPPPTTEALAAGLGVSREHLSRQFAAGGAPNLKRIIGLLVVLLARDLLANPGYAPATVAALLGFNRPAQLRETVDRVAGLSVEDLANPDTPDPIRRFLGARSRSRG